MRVFGIAGRLIEDPLLRDRSLVFRDRADAGRRLASFLKAYVKGGELVLAVPSGGVPVAYEISRALSLDMDLPVARKRRLPGDPEAGLVVCLNVRSGPAFAVAEAYEDWHDLTDDEVMRILDYMK